MAVARTVRSTSAAAILTTAPTSWTTCWTDMMPVQSKS
nr:MAG TPA: hypothetical protein [Bacteriophage sp.]